MAPLSQSSTHIADGAFQCCMQKEARAMGEKREHVVTGRSVRTCGDVQRCPPGVVRRIRTESARQDPLHPENISARGAHAQFAHLVARAGLEDGRHRHNEVLVHGLELRVHIGVLRGVRETVSHVAHHARHVDGVGRGYPVPRVVSDK